MGMAISAFIAKDVRGFFEQCVYRAGVQSVVSPLQTAVGAIGQPYVPSARSRSPSSRAC